MGAYSVTRLTVDADNNIVDLFWRYENYGESVSNTLRLATPYGNKPLNDCTEPVLVSWVVEQLSNTSEQLDTYLADRKARREYEQSLTDFVPHALRGPTEDKPSAETPSTLPIPIPEPEPEPEAPVTMEDFDPARITKIFLPR